MYNRLESGRQELIIIRNTKRRLTEKNKTKDDDYIQRWEKEKKKQRNKRRMAIK